MDGGTVTDRVAEIACKHYNLSLPKKGKPSTVEWTTFAAIVQSNFKPRQSNATTSTESSIVHYDYKVVAAGTGTKCLGQTELSPLGDSVSDSHAEILARRSFLLYLYNQMELALVGQQSILNITKSVQTSGSEAASSDSVKQFSIAKNVVFHIFISHVPCGDAAIIPSTEDSTQSTDHSEAKKRKLDKESISRTGAKLEAGPLVYETVQLVGKCRVKPGKGDPTICMSCSDKIAKWQALGLQGSLLGNFIPDPIRFSSVVIGAFVRFSQESIERALYTRFSDAIREKLAVSLYPELLNGYSMPTVAQASINFINLLEIKNKNPSPGSIVWYLGSDNVQVIVNGRKQGATKKNFGKPIAMVEVCRANLFSVFLEFRRRLSSAPETIDLDELVYADAKKLNKRYCSSWSLLKTEVMLGWTDKPN